MAQTLSSSEGYDYYCANVEGTPVGMSRWLALLKSGAVKGKKRGRSWVVNTQAIDAFLKTHKGSKGSGPKKDKGSTSKKAKGSTSKKAKGSTSKKATPLRAKTTQAKGISELRVNVARRMGETLVKDMGDMTMAELSQVILDTDTGKIVGSMTVRELFGNV